ncbi:hypothetical protein [Nitrobacter winogradskyi]|uniref:Uncharacterized protein n=2 Tax=Nitrobacter winogradskyi TaxID=913 RepID=A0ACC6AJE4_NITWI|nr:hypothetical protein [Nitrobacter winogradskyi]MCP1998980.1 hypothetical protein [Nitrobacter winogradskyi]GEC16501.1 hypothetical protein NWI01_23930 [Nitrobacter winogradskyi]
MSDDIKYKVERARNLSRELTVRDEHGLLSKSDAELCADALASYSSAIHAGEAAQDLDDLTRRIIGYHADDQAHDFRTREIHAIGATDCEFLARALTFYARELDEPPTSALAA